MEDATQNQQPTPLPSINSTLHTHQLNQFPPAAFLVQAHPTHQQSAISLSSPLSKYAAALPTVYPQRTAFSRETSLQVSQCGLDIPQTQYVATGFGNDAATQTAVKPKRKQVKNACGMYGSV